MTQITLAQITVFLRAVRDIFYILLLSRVFVGEFWMKNIAELSIIIALLYQSTQK